MVVICILDTEMRKSALNVVKSPMKERGASVSPQQKMRAARNRAAALQKRAQKLLEEYDAAIIDELAKNPA